MRTLCVVPRSHLAGDLTDRIIGSVGLEKWACETISPEYKVLDADAAEACARARFVDTATDEALLVVWNARTVHQGYDASSGDFRAPRCDAERFDVARDDWPSFLAREGFAAVKLGWRPGEVREAELCLARDVGVASLGELTEARLPQFGNTGIRMGGGLAQGEFAWYVRSHPSVRLAFARLYPGDDELRGSLGSPAISLEGAPRSNSVLSSGQWLHVDYSPPVDEGAMYQGCVYLPPPPGFSRLGCMVTMAPARLCGPADRLVAAAFLGHASKATGGLRYGLLQPIAPYPPKKGLFKRLAPALRPGVVGDQSLAKGLTVREARKLSPAALLARAGAGAVAAVLPDRVLAVLGVARPPPRDDAAARHPRPPPELAKPRVLVYTMGKNSGSDVVDCTVPTPPLAAPAEFAGLGFFGPCLHRFRRELRKRHKDALDRGDVVDVEDDGLYLLGVTAPPPRAGAQEPYAILHFSQVVKVLSYRAAHAKLADVLDAMVSPDTVKCPLMVEPCGVDGRSYRHRGSRCVYDATNKGWVTAISSLAAHPLGDADGVPDGFEIDVAALERKTYAAVPDATNGDCCFLVKSLHYALPGGPALKLDAAVVAHWAHLVDGPTPANPRCGVRGYGLNVAGAEARALVDVVAARCPTRPKPPGAMPARCPPKKRRAPSDRFLGRFVARRVENRASAVELVCGRVIAGAAAGLYRVRYEDAPLAGQLEDLRVEDVLASLVADDDLPAPKKLATDDAATPPKKRPKRASKPDRDDGWRPADVLWVDAWLRAEVRPVAAGGYVARWVERGLRSQSAHDADEVRLLGPADA